MMGVFVRRLAVFRCPREPSARVSGAAGVARQAGMRAVEVAVFIAATDSTLADFSGALRRATSGLGDKGLSRPVATRARPDTAAEGVGPARIA